MSEENHGTCDVNADLNNASHCLLMTGDKDMHSIPISRSPGCERFGDSSGSASRTSSYSSGCAYHNRFGQPRSHEDQQLVESDGKSIEIDFYSDSGNYQRILVEEGLRAVDLCQLLVMKNRANKDVNWTIIEVNVEEGIERIIEDHEEILAVYQQAKYRTKFLFKREFRKYEFFHSPLQFFPPDMCEIKGTTDTTGDTFALARNFALQNSLTKLGECPPIFGYMWFKEQNRQVWSKVLFTLENGILAYSRNCSRDKLDRTEYATMMWYNIYSITHSSFRTPTDFGICLVPLEQSTDSSSGTKYLFCDSDKAKVSWIAAMRMARYGAELRDNYLQSRQKLQESFSPSAPEYFSPYNKDSPNDNVKPRVAMDFTGLSGRIVEDPREAMAIAMTEGHSWRKKWGLNSALGPSRNNTSLSMLHTLQPWFHGSLSREATEQLLRKHGTVDGVFLIRNSQSRKGSFVLSFIFDGRIYHSQIMVVMDTLKGLNSFTLDKGETKFFDLMQLVDFYQLNKGCLPVRLSYYLVANASKCGLQTDCLYASSC